MIVSIAVFLIAITIHEFAHSWVADYLGDPNPRLSGRLSLNPKAHIDLLGTILLPLFLSLSGSPIVFGWAKPVMIEPGNFRKPRRDMALVGLAGPASNLLAALLVSLFLGFLPSALFGVGFVFITTNLVLAVFNLLPIPPLDGSNILLGLLPFDLAERLEEGIFQYRWLLLIASLLPLFNGQSLVDIIIGPVVGFLAKLFFSLSLKNFV
ncbi:MAG: site-2 protease family protein [Patescibacteria group bacterium]